LVFKTGAVWGNKSFPVSRLQIASPLFGRTRIAKGKFTFRAELKRKPDNAWFTFSSVLSICFPQTIKLLGSDFITLFKGKSNKKNVRVNLTLNAVKLSWDLLIRRIGLKDRLHFRPFSTPRLQVIPINLLIRRIDAHYLGTDQIRIY
jgi:hypothetical protein